MLNFKAAKFSGKFISCSKMKREQNKVYCFLLWKTRSSGDVLSILKLGVFENLLVLLWKIIN